MSIGLIMTGLILIITVFLTSVTVHAQNTGPKGFSPGDGGGGGSDWTVQECRSSFDCPVNKCCRDGNGNPLDNISDIVGRCGTCF